MKKNGKLFNPKSAFRIVIIFLVFSMPVIFLSCPPVEEQNNQITETEEESLPDSETDSVVLQILADMEERNPDYPESPPLPEFQMLDQDIDGVSEEDKAKLAEDINTINGLLSNPYSRIQGSASRSLSRLSDFETFCEPATPASSRCLYTYTENNGLLDVVWSDTRTMEQEGDNTVYMWIIAISYFGTDSDGGYYEYPNNQNFLSTQSSTCYPTGLIDYESMVRNYTLAGNCDAFEWTQCFFKYDSIEKKYETHALINECDFFEHIQHTRIRCTSEWDEPELFKQPVYHNQTFIWSYGKKSEYLWIDWYIDMNDMTWSYTVYNEDGVVTASGQS